MVPFSQQRRVCKHLLNLVSIMHATSKTNMEIKQPVILSLFYLIILNGTLTLFGDLLTYFINTGSEYFSEFLRFFLFLTGPLFVHWPPNDDSNCLKEIRALGTQDYLSFKQVSNNDLATWWKDTFSITFWVPLMGSSYVGFLHAWGLFWLVDFSVLNCLSLSQSCFFCSFQQDTLLVTRAVLFYFYQPLVFLNLSIRLFWIPYEVF